MFNLVFLFFIIFVFAYGWKIQRLKRHVLRRVQHYCHSAGVMLLDETVALKKLSLAQLRGRRTWTFEFTVTGAERYQGEAFTLHNNLVGITLPPHRFQPDNE